MNGFLTFFLDLVLTGLLIAGIVYAVRLSQQIAGLRAGREDMERFVAEFSATVDWAEAGVRGLKQAARSSGDDLEQLIEKAQAMRDELQFLTASADKIASRLGDSAGAASRQSKPASASGPDNRGPAKALAQAGPTPEAVQKALASVAAITNPLAENKGSLPGIAPSAAEQELLKALQKLG
jgi:hypothetical protein